MSLPKLNSNLKYEITLPASGKHVTYRPFLVGEEKIFMMAKEAGDQKSIFRAVRDVLSRCVDGDINVPELPISDVETLFLQIRAKSVGEEEEFNVGCQHCGVANTVPFDFEKDIYFKKVEEVETKVSLTDDLQMSLRYPTFADIEKATQIGKNETEASIRALAAVIDTIYSDTEAFKFADHTYDEQEEFISSLSRAQMKPVKKFMENMPTLIGNASYACGSCGKHNDLKIEGLASFFT